jgi:hypothetical protein
MTPAEVPELMHARTSAVACEGARPANDNTGATEDTLSSLALLRFGSALMVAGGAVIVGVLMAAVAVKLGGGARSPVTRPSPASHPRGAARRARASAPASPAST